MKWVPSSYTVSLTPTTRLNITARSPPCTALKHTPKTNGGGGGEVRVTFLSFVPTLSHNSHTTQRTVGHTHTYIRIHIHILTTTPQTHTQKEEATDGFAVAVSTHEKTRKTRKNAAKNTRFRRTAETVQIHTGTRAKLRLNAAKNRPKQRDGRQGSCHQHTHAPQPRLSRTRFPQIFRT